MKTTTTYPTKHPHWIDEDNHAAPRRKRVGISFGTAIAIVMAAHVAVIAGVYFYPDSKPKKTPPAPLAEKEPGPKSDALARNKWPEPEAKPEVVAKPPAQQVVKAAPKATPVPAPKTVSKSVPEPVKRKAAVAAAKNPPAVTQEAKTGSGAEEELRRRFLAAAGKTAEARSKPVEAQKPQAAAAPVAPKPVAATRADTVPAPAPRPTRPAATHYTLAPGDNLYMVSRKLGVSYNDLAKANGIRDPRQLRVGQTLKVPGGSAM